MKNLREWFEDYNVVIEVLPDTVKEVFPVSEVSPVSVSSSKLPSRAPVQYNNCTININYSASPNFGNMPQYTSCT